MFPRMPYSMRKAERQITRFLGLNLTENTKEGEFADAYGITTAKYPCLSQRDSRRAVEGYSAPTDVFEWDGKTVVVEDGFLYYDGVLLDNVSEGKKQFAVLNNQIVVLPDRICINATDGTYRRLGATTVTVDSKNSASFTTNSITAEISPVIKSITSAQYSCFIQKNPGENETIPVVYAYGTDTANLEACWDKETKVWKELESIEELKTVHHSMAKGVEPKCLQIGDIVILKRTNNSFSLVDGVSTPSGAESAKGELPDKALYNSEGYYGVISGYADECLFEVVPDGNAPEDQPGAVVDGIYRIKTKWKIDVYSAEKKNALFSTLFAVGDYVNISGTANGVNDVSHAKIIEIDDDTNTLVFEDGTFVAELYGAYKVASGSGTVDVELVVTDADGSKTYYQVANIDRSVAQPWDYLCIIGDTARLYRKSSKSFIGESHKYFVSKTASSAHENITALTQSAVKIEVPFPELDYVCAKDNRLWGVSNKDNTVYVSALGKPNDFYSYDTADSYAVALGSDGDFTAICAYGDSVLCWKEDVLHKFYGDMPSNYRCTDVKIAGVQKGSDRSLAVIDEKLYYKGTFGVYVYSGGLPQKISYNLGDKLLTDAVGGGYRDRYYLSAKKEDGSPALLVYDITHGLWMQEDKLYADAFARVGTALYMLSDGVLYECGAGDEHVPWMAEFVPFNETAHNRKGYAMLRLRLDMGARSHLRVEVRCDRGPWRAVFSKSATETMTVNVPLKIGRCDRFSVRLSGKGECVIRSLEREFFVGSKR